MILPLGIALTLLLLGGFTSIFIADNIKNDLSKTQFEKQTIDTLENLHDNQISLPNFLIIILVLFLPILFISLLFPPEKKEYIKKKFIRKNESPEEILKRRYANGEIDSFEYTERMSRL